ncbi:MAG: response regulator [Magnetococcales bacterium]|nr:response regulator [Magnetococcales bacterium]
MKPRILIVDDKPENRLAVCSILDGMEADLVECHNGMAALERVLEEDFALILLDAHMPEMDGFEMLQLMASVERTRRLPIIFLTAIHKDEQHIHHGYHLGAVDYMLKPFNPTILRGKVAVFLDLYRQRELIRQQAADLERQRHRLQLFHDLTGRLDDELMIFDAADGRLLEANQAALDRLGRQPGNFPSAGHIRDAGVLTAAGDDDWETLIGQLRQDGSRKVERDNRLPGGAERITEANLQLTQLEGRDYLLVVVRDVTRRRLTEQALQTARDEAHAATRAKSRFLAGMSHEIRSPMNAVIGMTSLLLESPLDAEQRQFARMVLESAESLLDILNDILDFSKVEAGKLSLERIPFALQEVFEKAGDTLALQAHKKGLELILDLHPALPNPLLGDPVRLRQVIINLLNNAIKFTPRGDVVVAAAPLADPPHDDGHRFHLHCRVTDTGIGIEPGNLERIFDSFTQADDTTSRQFGGTGLGLAISRELVRLMGGRLWVESQPGAGSTFHITVPFDPAPPVPGTAPARSDPVPWVDRPVLLLEQNPTARRVLSDMLTRLQVRVTAPASLAEATDLLPPPGSLVAAPFDILLVSFPAAPLPDDPLPDFLGRAGQLALCLAVLLPANQRPAALPQWGRFTPRHRLIKPVKPAQLEWLLADQFAPTPVPDRIPAGPPVLRRNLDAKILLVEDDPGNRLVATRFLVNAGCRVTEARDGLEALNRLAREDYDMVLMDVGLPGMDGLEALRRIRGGELPEVPADIPLLVVSAQVMEEEKKRFLQAGADGFLAKPYLRAQLLGKVTEMMDLQAERIRQRLRNHQPVISAPAPARPPGDLPTSGMEIAAGLTDLMAHLSQALEQAAFPVVEELGLAIRQTAHHHQADFLRYHAFRLVVAARSRLPDHCREHLTALQRELQRLASGESPPDRSWSPPS